jgi:hypothetical protein
MAAAAMPARALGGVRSVMIIEITNIFGEKLIFPQFFSFFLRENPPPAARKRSPRRMTNGRQPEKPDAFAIMRNPSLSQNFFGQ